MRRISIALCLALSACMPKSAADGSVYRAAGSPIYSKAVFDLAQLEGRWYQVAGFAASPDSSCRSGGATFTRKAAATALAYDLCLSGKAQSGAGLVTLSGPGRFDGFGRSGPDQDWWVLWVDEGYRTLVIGTPSGDFGFILNRDRMLPADRLAAAREVLDFNGYNLERLIVFRN